MIFSRKDMLFVAMFSIFSVLAAAGNMAYISQRQFGNGNTDTLEPPQILAHPAAEVFIHRETVSLSCQVTGNPPPEIEWLHQDLPFDPDSLAECSMSRQDPDGRLHIQIVGCWDDPEKLRDVIEGPIQCIAYNLAGTAFALPSKLIYAHIEHRLSDGVRTVTIATGDTLRLDCDGINSVPQPRYTWNHCGQSQCQRVPIGGTVPPKHWKDFNTGSLLVMGVTAEDAGLYECSAFNQQTFQSAHEEWNVTVQTEPAVMLRQSVLTDVLSSGAYQTVTLGSTVALKCFHSGRPQVELSWSFLPGESCPESQSVAQFEEIQEVRGRIAMATNNRVLWLRFVAPVQEGCYQCLSQGQGHSGFHASRMFLEVQAPPVFDLRPAPQRIDNGNEAFFTCRASGDPDPVITWFIDDAAYDPELHVRWRLAPDNFTLGLFNADVTDTSVVTCVAFNSVSAKLVAAYIVVDIDL